MARVAVTPTTQAAVTAIGGLLGQGFEEVELDALKDELATYARAAQAGDLSRNEAMLSAQATTLDLLFNKLTRQAVGHIGTSAETVSHYLKLALRAQGQCRATAETLHEMKYPQAVSFVQQANIAHGPQLVNNCPRADEPRNTQNELLEALPSERMDTGATRTPTSGSTPLDAVGAFNGTTFKRRQGHGKS